MKKLPFPGAALALFAAVSIAQAADDTGTITKVNPKSDSITLDDGKVFTLAEGTEAESLKVGQKVRVTYNVKAGAMMATRIVPAN